MISTSSLAEINLFVDCHTLFIKLDVRINTTAIADPQNQISGIESVEPPYLTKAMNVIIPATNVICAFRIGCKSTSGDEFPSFLSTKNTQEAVPTDQI